MSTETTTKRTIRNIEAFIGKVVDSAKWNIPSGYHKCEMTGKLFAEDDLLVTFSHWKFEKQFLLENHIYVEDAAWLSDEGYDQIMSTLETLGCKDYYINC